ncbi:MAG: YkgJ family cysteine cluster protein [Acidobacteriota bacterium]
MKLLFDCSVCPAYCCTYPQIGVTRTDVRRIAKHFDLDLEVAIRRFCREVDGKLVLRHREDPIFNTACRFLDRETRRCTIYEVRPKICRSFPEERRCGYYDFLIWERKRQDDPECIP